MLTSSEHPSPRRRLVRPLALTLLAGLMLVLSISNGSASATEFQPKPFLSILYSCTAHQYRYDVLMYNQGSDWTTFTVSSQIGADPEVVKDYAVAPYDLVMIDFIVPEGVMGTFHVTNPDPPGIDDLRAPTADCIADPEGSVTLECPDGDGAPTLVYDWVNWSYTAAHVVLGLPDGTTKQYDHSWFDHEQSLEVPVNEGDHVDAWIAVDGVVMTSLVTEVDCVPPPPVTTTTTTTTTTTVPSTTSTTSTTVPSTSTTTTVPSTTSTSTTVPKPSSTTSTTSTSVPRTTTSTSTTTPVLVEGVFVARPSTPVAVRNAEVNVDSLAVTGSNSRPLGLLGLGLLLLGTSAWLLAKRRQAS